MTTLFNNSLSGSGEKSLFKQLFREPRFKFFRCFLTSLFIHSSIFGLLFLATARPSGKGISFQPARRISESELSLKKEKALIKALEFFQNKAGGKATRLEEREVQKLEAILSTLREMNISPEILTEEDLTSFYQALLGRLFSGDSGSYELENKDRAGGEIIPFREKSPSREIQTDRGLVFIPPSSPGEAWGVLPKDRFQTLRRLTEIKPVEKKYALQGSNVLIKSPYGVEIVPRAYFYKKSPYEEILARGANLFYFVRGFPSLPLELENEKASGFLSAFEEKSFPAEIYFQGGMAPLRILFFENIQSPGKKRVAEAENKSTGKNEAYLNELIKNWPTILEEMVGLPEKEQLDIFLEKYLKNLDLNDPRVADLTEDFLTSNLNNVIIPINHISVAFDYLEELYFNKTFDRPILDFLRQHLKTRVGIQFLLYLASQYAFERRALNYLELAYKEAKEFLTKRFLPAEIYDQMAKSFIVVLIYEDVVDAARRQGYRSMSKIEEVYFKAEASCYQYLIELNEDYRDRGWFGLGCLYWNSGDKEKAIDCWQSISPDFPSRIWQDIVKTLTIYKNKEKAYNYIDKILGASSYENCLKLLNRLLKAGRWEKRWSQAELLE
jgi:hypothetical protein